MKATRNVGLPLAAILIACLATMVPTGASADVREGALELNGFGGLYVMEGHEWLGDAPSFGGRVGYFFTRDLSMEFTLAYTATEYDISRTRPLFNMMLDGQSFDMFHFRFEGLYHFETVADRFVPYVSLGAGFALLNGAAVSNKLDSEFTLGLGMKIFILDNLAFRADARYVIMLDKWLELTRVGNRIFHAGSTHYNNLETTFGLSYLFGGAAKDQDGDGVPNDLDACPDTPRGVIVDGRGCPLDSDRDGVFDGIDQCPDTPRGAWVDSRGCPKDTDGDGVLDGIDMCPDTQPGAVVNPEGCPMDSDGDGVPDGIDQCPNTPMGAIVDEVGCPIDSDGDGVPDGIDQCPDTTPGDRVDASGCSMVQKRTVFYGIKFEFNSTRIRPQSYETLNEVAKVLKNNPEIMVEIGGHTDSVGSAAVNKTISLKRAESVKKYLVGKGVPAKQMTTKGFGEAHPISTNKTAEGRALNRRIEFNVLRR